MIDRVLDRVHFRVWTSGSGKGDVLAILPDVDANPGMVVCYAHIGQHGEGRLSAIYPKTRPAKPNEYAPLLTELQGMGYELRAVGRIVRKHQPSGVDCCRNVGGDDEGIA